MLSRCSVIHSGLFALTHLLFIPDSSFPSPLAQQCSARSSPYAPWSTASSWNSRRSSWNSLGRAPSLKRQKRQSGERRSLLSGDGKSSSEEGEGSEGEAGSVSSSLHQQGSFDLPPDTLQVPHYLCRSASMHSARPPLAEHQDCNGKNSARLQQFSMDEPCSEEENIEDDGNMVRESRHIQ